MNRRSTPQAKIDDRAFPIRMFVHVPGNDFGLLFDETHRWLPVQCGSSYVRKFIRAFPSLELADGTPSKTYTSPAFPFGRHPI